MKKVKHGEDSFTLNASLLPSNTISRSTFSPSEENKCCGIHFANGIRTWNFLSILLLSFATNHCFIIEGSFSTLLLQDKTFYDVDIKDLAHTMANYKTIVFGTFTLLALFGRFIYQTWSYRTLIPLAAFVASLCVFLIPWGHSVYPGLLLIQFLLTFSPFIEGLSPMMVDYVQN